MAGGEKGPDEGYLDGRRGNVLRLKPGEAAPEGAVLINRSMVSEMKRQIIMKSPVSES